jgi:hypothetical protein
MKKELRQEPSRRENSRVLKNLRQVKSLSQKLEVLKGHYPDGLKCTCNSGCTDWRCCSPCGDKSCEHCLVTLSKMYEEEE